MGRSAAALAFLAFVSLMVPEAHAQPIPVELSVGHEYAATNLVVSRPFSPKSTLGFFHLSTVEILYEDEARSDLAIQNVLFMQLPRGLALLCQWP